MIDWAGVLENSVWLAGLAIIFAAFSLASYNAGTQGPGRQRVWRLFAGSAWTLTGAILFCLGMILTTGSSLEATVWAMLVPAVSILWAPYRPPTDTQTALQTTQAVAREDKDVAGRLDRLRRVAEQVVRFELLWLLLLSPIFLFPSTGPGILAVAALPLIWIARRLARGRFVPATPLDWPVCLIMLMVMVSLFVTFDPAFSLQKVTGLLLGIGVYYAIVEFISSGNRERLKWAVAGYAAAGLLLALVGLLATDWSSKLSFMSGVVGKLPSILTGLPGAENGINPNETAGALLWVLPVQISLALWLVAGRRSPVVDGGSISRARNNAVRAGAITAVAISAGVLLLAESRTALVAIAIGLLVFLWAIVPHTRQVAIVAGALALIAAGMVLYIGPGNIATNILSGSASFELGDYLRSAQSRMEIWSRAIYGIQDFPLTGMGMNAFRRLMPALYPSSYPPDSDVAHAHNHLLQVALDLGLPGLVAYVAIWLVCIVLVVELWRQAKTARVRWLAGGIGGGLAAYAIYGMVDTVALGAKPGIFFWGLIGLLVAAWQIEQVASKEPEAAARAEAATRGLTGEYEAVMIE
jgi:putative inorganic carbon (HCO3(-)) transporter